MNNSCLHPSTTMSALHCLPNIHDIISVNSLMCESRFYRQISESSNTCQESRSQMWCHLAASENGGGLRLHGVGWPAKKQKKIHWLSSEGSAARPKQAPFTGIQVCESSCLASIAQCFRCVCGLCVSLCEGMLRYSNLVGQRSYPRWCTLTFPWKRHMEVSSTLIFRSRLPCGILAVQKFHHCHTAQALTFLQKP